LRIVLGKKKKNHRILQAHKLFHNKINKRSFKRGKTVQLPQYKERDTYSLIPKLQKNNRKEKNHIISLPPLFIIPLTFTFRAASLCAFSFNMVTFLPL